MTQPKLVTIDASEPIEKINEIIARDGGVIVSNFIQQDLLQELMISIEPYFKGRGMWEKQKDFGTDFFPPGSQRIYALLAKIPTQITKICRLGIWQGIMEEFLSDEFARYTGDKMVTQKSGWMLATTAALRLVPGAKPQPLHQDQLAYIIRPVEGKPLYTPMVGCLIAGSKCTKRNGATAVIPGSHLWPIDRAPTVEECAYAEMAPGSALFTLGSTYHGAGANTSDDTDPDRFRTIFACFGQRDYYRKNQEEILSTPTEVLRNLPEDMLKIAGFCKAVSGVGYVEDHQNSYEFINSDGGWGRFSSPALKSAP